MKRTLAFVLGGIVLLITVYGGVSLFDDIVAFRAFIDPDDDGLESPEAVEQPAPDVVPEGDDDPESTPSVQPPVVEVLHEGDQPGECSDGADNDRDGDFDCKDSQCAGAPVCAEAEPPSVPEE